MQFRHYLCNMRRGIAYVLLAAVLFTQTELYQFLKLPVMFQHYVEHLEREPEISFSTYLVRHYFEHDRNDNDADRDMQLPFKTSDYNAVSGVTPGLPDQNSFVSAFEVSVARTLPSYSYDGYSSAHTSDIWQPPRRA